MLDFESTPIFQYEGPPERRKSLESLGRLYLGIVKGAMGGDLPHGKYSTKLPDGTILSVTSIRNSGVVDIIRAVVPVAGKEERKGKKGAHLEKDVKEMQFPVPLIVLNYDSDEPLAQVFMDCKGPMEKFPYPGGADDPDTYKMFGITCKRNKGGADFDEIEILSLRPIHDPDCSISTFIDNGNITLEGETTFDPPEVSGIYWQSFVKNICGVASFYYSGHEDPELVYPSGGSYDIVSGYTETTPYYVGITGGPRIAEMPDTTVVHEWGESFTIAHPACIEPVTSPPYSIIEGIPDQYIAVCDDEESHKSNEESYDYFTGSIKFIIASAVVRNARGYDDYSAWGAFVADFNASTLSTTVKLVLCDRKNGLRSYDIETVSGLFASWVPGSWITGTAKIDIFDYFGTPYFIASYVGISAVTAG